MACCIIAFVSPALAQPRISGTATVRDGDTLDMDGLRIRLFGVDAPEYAQSCTRPDGASWPCGTAALDALANRIGKRRIECEQRDVDVYRRSVAVCRLDGEDLNAWLVAEGWAVAYREFSEDYVDEEESARARRLNIWNGSVQMPEAYRRQQDGLGTTSRATNTNDSSPRADANCRIKGNISTSGERIYHVPSGEFYERTVISPNRGERMFCSEQEARAAGWRRSRQ
ncbi:MAG: thermonuclease family protein [Pseudomonadota bacterium]|nr:thermonuclease family protein [Pseudomonadota bacterium]